MTSPTQEELAAFKRDDERNREFYAGLLARYGATASGVNWRNAASQRTRFQIITEIGINPDASLLDIGCGTGALLEFMRARGFHGRYRGIDLTPVMIGAACQRFPDVEFDTLDLLDLDATGIAQYRADIVVASGIFYFRREKPVPFMHAMIKCMFSLCRTATVFNSLSTWADLPSTANEFRADPLEVLGFCRSITPFVAMRHDYHPGDFTVYMRRPEFARCAVKQA